MVTDSQDKKESFKDKVSHFFNTLDLVFWWDIFSLVLLVVVWSFFWSGLYRVFVPEVLEVKNEIVDVQVVNEYIKEPFLNLGAPSYCVFFAYEDMEFVVNNRLVYEEYRDDIGLCINATVEISTLKDGGYKYRLLELGS